MEAKQRSLTPPSFKRNAQQLIDEAGRNMLLGLHRLKGVRKLLVQEARLLREVYFSVELRQGALKKSFPKTNDGFLSEAVVVKMLLLRTLLLSAYGFNLFISDT